MQTAKGNVALGLRLLLAKERKADSCSDGKSASKPSLHSQRGATAAHAYLHNGLVFGRLLFQSSVGRLELLKRGKREEIMNILVAQGTYLFT